jgi:predicted nucleic acid-binding protein
MTVETVFIETTVVSYLVANRSRDLVLAAHQKTTREWWMESRVRYRCVTSVEVLREASLGDATMSRLRIEALASLPVLSIDQRSRDLARELMRTGLLPREALSDALHLAVATQHAVEYLLTWNCRHLANPHLLKRLRIFMAKQKLILPEICTPLELVGS